MSAALRSTCTGVVLAAGAALTGCRADHRQSILHPASEAAGAVSSLWWSMFAMLAASFVVVMVLLILALVRRPDPAREEEAGPRRTRRLVLGGGIAFPSVVLLAMLFQSLGTSAALRRSAEGLEIHVTGHQWWWDVRYPASGVVVANELHIPVGEPVVIRLRAADVVHSFWIPNLHGKIDMLPEMPTRLVIEADRPGRWRGQCAEFCGRQHAWMAFEVVALPREEFDDWVLERREAAVVASLDDVVRHGEEVFFRESCHTCHAVANTRAVARNAPDLTHIGSRLTLGAGRVANSDENLARWILDPQTLKPGNLMPATPLDEDDLAALVAYLRTRR
ncbi:cytochrome c oxidase subunit II [Opitutales bacterium ASA1]|uniref:cytochrome c oxidase subunit II n=1 Tax=Congregicoccus parvus TaxID=3081749 RepID=UPI002B31AE1E|nr:cytochrome c oxidase subunit II [Opitutales bacterium ASA1]